MFDQGRFVLEGIPFSWFVDQKSTLTVNSLLYGDRNIDLEPAADAESAAYRVAKELLLECCIINIIKLRRLKWQAPKNRIDLIVASELSE